MSNSYADAVERGEITSLKDYMYKCVRAFGAFIQQREDSLCVEPKYPVLDIDFYLESLAKSKRDLEYWQTVSAQEISKQEYKAEEESYNSNVRCLENIEIKNARCDAMIKKVQAWQPPTPQHERLKEFAIEQLKASRSSDEFIETYYRKPIAEYQNRAQVGPLDTEKIRQEYIQMKQRDIQRYLDTMQRIVARHQEDVEWINQFFNSLKEDNDENSSSC